jgi:cullin 1
MNKVKDMEAELYFISKLKEQFGMQSTFKMEGMIHDYNRCKDDVDSYGTNHSFPFVFQPVTYTYGNWPVLPNTELRVPSVLQECMQNYEDFYKSRNTMRRLTWVYTYGNIHISVNYPKRKTFDFMMNILQFVVFYHFMGNLREISYQEIVEKTCMNENYLKKVLHSLSCNKLKLLVKTPENNSISNQDNLRFFTDFNSPKRLNVIPSPPFEEVSVNKKVEEDRTHIIDSVVVRIMKTRRTLSHQELISSVVSQLMLFKPTIMDIKRRIENLIEREYLERDASNTQLYKYVA